ARERSPPSQYKSLLARVRPRDLAGKTRRRMAAGELAGLARYDARLKTMKAELKATVQARGSRLMDIHGIGPPAPPGSWPMSEMWPVSPTVTTSPPGPGPRPSMPPAVSTPATACPAQGTAG